LAKTNSYKNYFKRLKFFLPVLNRPKTK